MRLLGRPTSINVRKVMWTAAELGLAYRHEENWGSLTAKTPAPELLALNPNGLVPVWEDDRGVLWESNTICRYLANRHGDGGLFPAEPFARAEIEKWMDWQMGELNRAWGYAFAALGRRFEGYDDARRIERSAQNWNRQMLILEERLRQTGAHVAGAAFSLADIPIGLSVHRWLMTPIDKPSTPAVDAYMARLRERPPFPALATPELP